ncbi:hypothetical protein PFISCL1PPCAC_1730, partial [Pristionchus fissidentatus]
LLYFLYDPLTERSRSTGSFRTKCIVVFDLAMRCFTEEITLKVPGRVMFMFPLRPLTVGGSTRMVVSSQLKNGEDAMLHLTLVDLPTHTHTKLTDPLDIGSHFFITLREDAPELVVLSNPGLQFWRIAADASLPMKPIDYFRVDGAKLTHFYDGYVCGGLMFLISANRNKTVDHSRMHNDQSLLILAYVTTPVDFLLRE